MQMCSLQTAIACGWGKGRGKAATGQGHSSKINIHSLTKINSGEVKQKTFEEQMATLMRTPTTLLPWNLT
ncbi:hypothetical protein DUI87_12629 [Hirundo rustica rustica]|uniref:Uncharacterized protein n=1 Tax=Hirundo rustica rustica TaxID=333673 RepID=A0A3M0KCH3_HIRRU|nr:hypothetical protein DUI87_12629 [Hirundo rustica rustica]